MEIDRRDQNEELVSDDAELNALANGVNGNGAMGEANLMKKPMPVDVKRKAKKLSRRNSKEGTLGVAGAPNFIAPHRRWKNSRRSRDGYGRGLPKKEGGGKKGTWGKLGSELLEEEYLDQDDPNFNDEEFENVVYREIIPEITEEELLQKLEPLFLEYFEHGDTHEVAAELDETLIPRFQAIVVRKAIEMGLEHKNSHKEMISVLISDLFGKHLQYKDIEAGFDMLLQNLPDLMLDTPDAPHILGNFMARAVADDCLPPRYVHQLSALHVQSSENGHAKNGHENGHDEGGAARHLNDHATQALQYAEGHLSNQFGWAHLDNIWGNSGGLRPVKKITQQMELLLKEYILSRDVQEAHRCLSALETPHFHHELVYEAVIMTLEASAENIEEAMCLLLKSLDVACILTTEQIEQGFQRVFDDLQDISLDIPLAYILLERFVQRCFVQKIVPEKLVRNLPSRGRKRFVSEGDSGKFKPVAMMFREF